MAAPRLRKSYLVEASHGEVYTGGPVAYHEGFRSLIVPQEGRVNTLPLHNSAVYVFPISGDESRVTAVAVHEKSGRIAVAFQSGFVRIYEPTLKTASSSALSLSNTVESKIENASVRYHWTEIAKWKCEMVSCLAWDHFATSSPLVACACADGSIKVFDQLGAYCTHNFRGHSAPVTLVKFDRDTQASHLNSYVLYSASVDCTVRIWSLTESKQIGLLKNHMSPVTDLDFYNPPSSKKASQPHSDLPNTHGRMLVTVGRDKIISVYHLSKGFPLYTTIPTYESLESCIVMTELMPLPTGVERPSEGFLILVGGESGVLKLWHSKSAKCVFEQPKSNAKTGIDYLLHIPKLNRKSKFLNEKGRSKVEEAEKALLKEGVDGNDDGDDNDDRNGKSKKSQKSSSQKMDQDENEKEDLDVKDSTSDTLDDMIVAVTSDQNMILHPTSTLEAGDTIVGYNDEIIDAAFVSATEVAVAANSTELRIFSLPSFSSRTMGLNDEKSAHHKEAVMAIAVSPCKQMVVSASKDQTMIVWSLITGKSLALLTGHTQSISTVQFFNQSSRYIVSGGRDLTWKIWDIQPVIDKGHDRSGIDRVAGSILTVKSHQKDVNCVAISPNDGLLATGSQDKEIKLFSIDSIENRQLKEYGVLRGHRRGVWDVAFSPIDQVLASASADNTIKLWNLRDFTCIKTFEGHTASVLKVKFISNGLQLISSGADGLVKLWNVHDNECVNTFDKHEDKIWALAVDETSDGGRFVTGGGDSMLCLWADNTQAEIEADALQRDEMIQLEQSLKNFVRDGKFVKALSLALQLHKPLQALHIIEAAIAKVETAEANLRDMVGALDFDATQLLLSYLRDWNTNAKHSHVAQSTLFQLFHTYRAHSMTQFPLMKDLLQALIPYSTRHFQRLDKLLQASYILDYTLEAMNLLPDLDGPTSSASLDPTPHTNGNTHAHHTDADATGFEQDEPQASTTHIAANTSNSTVLASSHMDIDATPKDKASLKDKTSRKDKTSIAPEDSPVESLQESLPTPSKTSSKKKRKRSASTLSNDEEDAAAEEPLKTAETKVTSSLPKSPKSASTPSKKDDSKRETPSKKETVSKKETPKKETPKKETHASNHAQKDHTQVDGNKKDSASRSNTPKKQNESTSTPKSSTKSKRK